jgi:hypothetical protein
MRWSACAGVLGGAGVLHSDPIGGYRLPHTPLGRCWTGPKFFFLAYFDFSFFLLFFVFSNLNIFKF